MASGGLVSSKKRRRASEQVVPVSWTPNGNLSFSGLRGSGLHEDPRRMFADPSYPIPNFHDSYSKMRHPEQGIPLADRRYRLLVYRKCFVGNEAVTWMVQNLDLNRKAAVSIGNRLMSAGIISHVAQSEPFQDGFFFYRFQEDDDGNVLNLKRVWDSNIETRDAVVVSQELLTQLACLCEEYRECFIARKNANAAAVNNGGQSDGQSSLPSPDPLQVLLSSSPAIRDRSLSSFSVRETNASSRTIQDTNEPSSATHDTIVPSRPIPDTNASYTTIRDTNVRSRSLSDSNFPSSGLPNGALMSPMFGSFPSAIPSSSEPPLVFNTTSGPDTAQNNESSGFGDDIDFSLLAKSEAFRKYTLAAAELQRVQLLGLSHDELMAFFVNVYNALSLHAYVVHGPPNFFWRRWTFFRSLSYRIAGLDFTLDCIEHGILRVNKRAPNMPFLQFRPTDPKCQLLLASRDGRIHFVISAGTKSDPPIRILNGENVQEELYEASVEFLTCSVKVEESGKITLPRIFYWYAADFPSPETDLLRWIAGFLPIDRSAILVKLLDTQAKLSVSYETFDWNNAEARFEAAAIRRKRRKLARERAVTVGTHS